MKKSTVCSFVFHPSPQTEASSRAPAAAALIVSTKCAEIAQDILSVVNLSEIMCA